MALDLSRFATAFFEESLEHLSGMERLLLGLDLLRPDAEALNAIFRAAHSVKGGAGIFGFQDLADLTHVLESLLDRVRKGELKPTKRLVDLVLATGDVMRRHVTDLQGGGATDADAMQKAKEALESFAAGRGGGESGEGAAEGQKSGGRFHVSIALDPAAFPDEASVDELLEDVAGAGKITVISKGIEDGFKTPLTFEIETDVAADELRDSLEFLVAAESINIGDAADAQQAEPSPAPAAAGSETAAEKPAAAASDDAYGFFEPLPAKASRPPDEPPQDEPVHQEGEASGPRPPERRMGEDRRSGVDRRVDVEAAGVLEGSSIRINVEKVDQLVNLVGELVIAQSMVSQSARQAADGEDARLLSGLTQLERNTRDLQEAVMSIRMLPIGFVFNRFPRLVRDLAGRLGKRVRLEIQGEDTELDKGLIERIADPLTHLVRNALDHGIELPRERTAKGKPMEGVLSLTASHQAGAIVISVSDDGAGIDRDKVLAKARANGMTVDDAMSDQEVYQIIFAPGFSTASVVTDVSGRGVGMDVVKRNVSALGGRIEIDSSQGTGTTIRVRLPLTLAIIDGMSVRVRDQIYIVPLAQISESLQPSAEQLKTVSGGEVVNVRNEYLPVVSLSRYLGMGDGETERASQVLVILESERGRAAIRVDELVGQQQVVLKSLEANFRKVQGLSGATIMGDGRVAFILDVAALVGSATADRAADWSTVS